MGWVKVEERWTIWSPDTSVELYGGTRGDTWGHMGDTFWQLLTLFSDAELAEDGVVFIHLTLSPVVPGIFGKTTEVAAILTPLAEPFVVSDMAVEWFVADNTEEPFDA